MNRPDESRRAVAALKRGAGQPTPPMIGQRSLHHYWSLLLPHFRGILLPPQTRSDDGGVQWSWREPANRPPIVAAELATVRKRLTGALRSLADSVEDAPQAAADARRGASVLPQIQARMNEVVATLAGLPDVSLAGYVVRAERSLMVHSWGLAAPLSPQYPDATDCEITGTVFLANAVAPDHEVVLERPDGGTLARTRSDAAGKFRFPKVTPGRYHACAVSPQGKFPPGGVLVEIELTSVTGLELRDRADDGAAILRGAPPNRRRPRALFFLFAAIALTITGVTWWRWPAAPRASQATAKATADLPAPAKVTPNAFVRPRTDATKDNSTPGPFAAGVAPGIPTTKIASLEAHSQRSKSEEFPQRDGGRRPTVLVEQRVAGFAADSSGAVASAAPPSSAANAAAANSGAPGNTSAGAGAAAGSASTTAAASVGAAVASSASAIAAAAASAATSTSAVSVAPPLPPPNPSTPPPAPPPVPPVASAHPPTRQPSPETKTDQPAPVPSPPATTTANNAAPPPPPFAAAAPADDSPAEKTALATGADPASAEPPADRAAPADRSSPTSAVRVSDKSPPTAPTTAGALSPKVADPVFATAATDHPRRVRLHITAWQPRLLQDAILPTAPTRVGDDDDIEVLRARLLRERQAAMPLTFKHPAPRIGFAIDLPAETMASGRPHWRDVAGGTPTFASVTATRAEVYWSGNPPTLTECTLLDDAGREFARVTADGSGGALVTAPRIRGWPWVGLERTAADDTARNTTEWATRLEWRVLSGAPAPPSWRRDDFWLNNHGHRLDLILSDHDSGPAQHTLALVDRPTGWALVCEIDQAQDLPESTSTGRTR